MIITYSHHNVFIEQATGQTKLRVFKPGNPANLFSLLVVNFFQRKLKMVSRLLYLALSHLINLAFRQQTQKLFSVKCNERS
jgi:hypothetical protein